MKEATGKVYRVATYSFKCEDCEFDGQVYTYFEKEETEDLSDLLKNLENDNEEYKRRRLRIGFCPCGNVFIRILPQSKREVK